MSKVIQHGSAGSTLMQLLEAKRNKFNVSGRLLAISRRMGAERSTKGTEEELRTDAERQLSESHVSRARANSILESDSSAEHI